MAPAYAPPAGAISFVGRHVSYGARRLNDIATFLACCGFLRMAREHWIESLVCRHCRKEGIAVLSTEDKFSWIVQVESVPKGFRVIQSENGSNFHCSSCDCPVEP
jgi:hypothetical protein